MTLLSSSLPSHCNACFRTCFLSNFEFLFLGDAFYRCSHALDGTRKVKVNAGPLPFSSLILRCSKGENS